MAKKGINAPILWSKCFYGETFLDNSLYRGTDKETGDWSGTLFIYKFNIVQYKNTNRLIIEPDIKRFGGSNKEEMEADLVKETDELEEWDTKGKNYRNDVVFYPPEVEQKLKEFNIKK
jgi:hypothetical protein